jgi:hypothetical protein
MPKGGWFFDSIIRQQPIDNDTLDMEDNLQEFGPISDSDLNYFAAEAQRLYTQTDKAILAIFGGTAFGDIALVPAPWLKNPKGIRDIEEWYISTAVRRDFIYNIFDRQCQIALANFKKLYQAIGNKIAAVYTTGTDFGTQNGPFISPQMYRDLYQPFHKQVNNWIHQNTTWKTFMHSCGSITSGSLWCRQILNPHGRRYGKPAEWPGTSTIIIHGWECCSVPRLSGYGTGVQTNISSSVPWAPRMKNKPVAVPFLLRC